MHWHGLRLENRYDGVPHETQEPIGIVATFTYKVQFPDAGFYWYHPHIREDFGLEMGLYGTIVVEPTDPLDWSAVDRQSTLTLDDLLIEDGTHRVRSAGRRPELHGDGSHRERHVDQRRDEVRRRSRPRRGGAAVSRQYRQYADLQLRSSWRRAKLVGGDSGRYERETFIDEVTAAPRSGRWSMSCSILQGRYNWNIAPPITPTTSVRSSSRAIGSQVRRRPSRASALTLNSQSSTARSSQTTLMGPTRSRRVRVRQRGTCYPGGTQDQPTGPDWSKRMARRYHETPARSD